MIKRILKSNRGSALLFVLIAITVLSLLGVSIMSLAVSSLKVKLSERDAKESQYLSEYGLDQAFKLASDVVKEAVIAGKNKVDAFINKSIEDDDSNVDNCLDKFIEEERKNERNNIKDSPYIDGTSGNGTVNEEELKGIFNEKFKESYKDYVNDYLLGRLENADDYEVLYEDDSELIISCDPDSYIEYDTNVDTSVITLESQYSHKDISKTIAVDFVIKIPDYDQEYTVETVSGIEKSALFDKVLAADGNIIVKGSDVSIVGDVFAGGDDAETESFGLVLGDAVSNTQGNLSVEGRIFTGGDIRINSDDSSLEAYGDIYCSNIKFRDVENGNVTVGSDAQGFNVHTLNGIILDGSGSSVDIHGKYYGFSRGQDTDVSRSTILINDQYPIESGTHINITGEDTSNDKFPDGTSKPSGNVIAGSNFVPLGLTRTADAEGRFHQVLYQTGESIAIIGNYEAYSRQLVGVYPKAEGEYNYNWYNINFENISVNDAVLAIEFKDDGSGNKRPFGGYEPVVDEVTGYKLYKGIEDKSLYFKYAYDESSAEEKDDFRFKSVEGIKNIIFSMGAYPQLNENSGKIEVLKPKPLDEYEDVIGLLPNFRHEYHYYINDLGNPKLDYEDAGAERKSVADFVDEDKEIDNTTLLEAKDLKQLFYSGEEDIAIGSDADINAGISADAVRYDVSEIKAGIVYTKGDVYLTGLLDYTGTIIAEGDIYILGNETKTIRVESEDGSFSVEKKVFEDFLNISTKDIGDIFDLEIISVFTDFKGTTAGEDNLYINFKEIIDTNNWRKIR